MRATNALKLCFLKKKKNNVHFNVSFFLAIHIRDSLIFDDMWGRLVIGSDKKRSRFVSFNTKKLKRE